MDINVICVFPDELFKKLKVNYILMGLFKVLTEDVFKTMCHTLINLMFSDDSTFRLDEEFYHKFAFLEMSKIECNEFVRVVIDIFLSLGARFADVDHAIRKLENICKFMRTFKSHKREMAVSCLETILKEAEDLNKQRPTLIEQIESIKMYQDTSHFNLPYFFSNGSSYDSPSGETELNSEIEKEGGWAAPLIVLSNTDLAED